jgi:acyl carrier protein
MSRQDCICCHFAAGASAVKSAASGLSKSSISSLVASTVSAVLGPDVNPDEPLMASGLDSLGAVELRNSLQAQLPPGLELPATLLFDFPSVNAISGYIASQVLHLVSASALARKARLWYVVSIHPAFIH